jgi:NTE family protein
VTEQKKCDLVLEGGGVEGIGLVGAVSVLEEAGYSVQRVAGTSAGAIVGSLVAAGIPAAELREIMEGLDYRRFQDRTLVDRIPLIGPACPSPSTRASTRGATCGPGWTSG